MKIIVSETQIGKVLNHPEIIEEQNETLDDQRTLIVLQNKINDLIDKKEKEILDKIGVKVVSEKGVVTLKIGEKTYPMKSMVQGVYAIIIPPKSKMSFAGPQMVSLAAEIEKIPEYKQLTERHPELKEQIQRSNVTGTLFTDEQNQGTFKLTVTKKLDDPKYDKLSVPLGTEYPLGEFLERNRVIYKFKDKATGETRYATLESGQISMNLASAKLSFQNKQLTGTNVKVAPIVIKTVVLQDLFNFNDAEFKNPQGTNQQMGTYVQQIKNYIQQYGQPFIDAFKAQSPTVLGYASIDGDPEQEIVGDYKPCAGNKIRSEYDLCLSHQRARKIAEELNKLLPELDGAFKFKGMGQTTQWGPGWTKESPTIPEKTASNRRYILPQINVSIQQQPK